MPSVTDDGRRTTDDGGAAGIRIRVASLLERPRGYAAHQAEEVYRASETLALGLDIALNEHGVKRTSLIAQRVNRVAFAESWTPPGGLDHFESVLLALDAGRPLPPSADGIDPNLPQIRLQIGAGTWPTRFPHLLGHAEAPWYYVAREFPLPLWLPEPQAQIQTAAAPGRVLSVGAVPLLAQELEALEPLLLAHDLDPAVWFPAPLLEATALSLETGLVIVLTASD